MRAWATPGHTAEHLAYLLLDGAQVLGVFTGGSLLVGAAARTDLSGQEQAEPLARAQYASLGRLLALPDATPVYPTHGAGSFCSAPPGAERTTTIGREKATNPLLAAGDEDAFVKALLASLGTFPGYFLRLPEENRRGPAILASAPALAPLTPRQVLAIQDDGGQVIDVRPVASYAAGHIPGSLAIPLREAFATWLGWLAPDPASPAGHRRRSRPGSRRGHLAGAEDRIRQPRRNPGRRHARLGSRRAAGRGHPVAHPRAGGPGCRPRRAPGRRVRERAPARCPQH